jgi:2-oxoisovalerate dehydrogenase E1 component alpha subunit
MSSYGELGCVVGSAAGLEPRDLMYSQYRELGAHYWRGYTIDNIINQCMGNAKDYAKGRQMPIHVGSKALNNVTVSSPLSIYKFT